MPLPERARARHKGRGRLTVLRKHDMSIVFASMQSGERSELQLCWIARVRAKPRARARARRIRSGENPKSSRSRRIPSSCRTVIDVSAIILFTFNGLRIVILRPLPLIFNKCNLTIKRSCVVPFFSFFHHREHVGCRRALSCTSDNKDERNFFPRAVRAFTMPLRDKAL